MTSSGESTELNLVREKASSLEMSLVSLSSKVERISEIITALDKLETRVRGLEERKSQLDDLVAYKNASDVRIRALEETEWYYKGGLNTIVAILVSSGIVGAILGLIISKVIFPP